MAETKSKRSSSRKSSSSGSSKRSSSSRSSRSNNNRPMREMVAEAVGQLQELIGRPVESVTGMEKDGSEWRVKVEVLELERIPNTTDVLGIYEVTLDKNGDLIGAQRTRRYFRSEAGED